MVKSLSSNGSVLPQGTASNTAEIENRPVHRRDSLELDDAQFRSTAAAAGVELPAIETQPTRPRGQARSLLPHKDKRYQQYRRLCEQIVVELRKIDDFLKGDEVTEEGLEVVVEVEALLEKLYDCPWGKEECLKRVVVAIQSQVNNTQWQSPHVAFLKEIAAYLRVRYVIDERTVTDCYEMIKHHGLDPFRGTVSETAVVKKYRLEEVKEA